MEEYFETDKQTREMLKKCPKTVFDSEEFKIKIDLNNSGHAIRDELVSIYNLYGRINSLAAKAAFVYEMAKIRRDKAESLAWEAIYADKEKASLKISAQKVMVMTVPIEVDGEQTTLIEEDERLIKCKYLCDRGKDKVRELSALLDIGRSVLSWDKTELEKMPYDS